MVHIILFVFSASVDATTCLCRTPPDLNVEKELSAYSRALVPSGAGTNSAASILLLLASSFLFVTLIILLLIIVLHYFLHYATNLHERVSQSFLRLSSLRPCTADRTCPGYDRGSAGTRQGDPSSRASVQLPSALAPTAGRPRGIVGKRPSGDESDAEENDRDKRRRIDGQEEPKATVRCPWQDQNPGDPEFDKCGRYTSWSHLREHILDRKHKARERCPTCGKIFFDGDKWAEHTSQRVCQPSVQPLRTPFWVNKFQDAKIRELTTRGRKNAQPIEEMYRKVCEIVFGDEIAPDRTASGHPIWSPHVQHTDDFDTGSRMQDPWHSLTWEICHVLRMQDVPDDTVRQIIDCVRRYDFSRAQAHAVQGHEPVAGEAAVGERIGTIEAGNTGLGLPAEPLQGQVARIPEPQGHDSTGPSYEQLELLAAFVRKEANDPLTTSNDTASSPLPLPTYSAEFTPTYDTSPGEFSLDPSLDTNYLDSMEIPDSSNYAFNLKEDYPDLDPVQFCWWDDPKHRPGSGDDDQDAPRM